MADLLPWQVPSRIGNPFHGKILAGQVHLPNGSTMPWPYSLSPSYTPVKLKAPDAPAVSTTPEETEAGREWRNYVLYQYGSTDPYHQNNLSSGSSAEEVLGEWFYMPVFGKKFQMRMVGPGVSYPGPDRTYKIGVVNGAEIYSVTLTNLTLRLADVCDGAGDKVMLMKTSALTGSNQAVLEYVLSYNTETGEVTLVENVIDNVPTSNTSGSTLDRIRKYTYQQDTTVIGSYTCNNGGAEDIEVPLHQTVRTPLLVPLTEPESAAYETLVLNVGFRYLGNSTFTQNINELLGAVYQDGIGKSVRLTVNRNDATTETVERVIEGQSHEEEAAPCGSWNVVVDTPFKYDAQFVSITSNSTLSKLLVGGVVVAEETATFEQHQEKYYADGYIEAVTVEGAPIDGWDVNTSSSSGGNVSVSQVSGIHPMWTVRNAPGDACQLLHTFGLTSGFNRLNSHSLNHVAGNATEEASVHSWV